MNANDGSEVPYSKETELKDGQPNKFDMLDNSALLELKAELLQKKQEYASYNSGKKASASKRPSFKKEGIFSKRNANIDQRIKNDELESEKDDVFLKSRLALIEKAKIYDEIVSGKYGVSSKDGPFLVDFDSKQRSSLDKGKEPITGIAEKSQGELEEIVDNVDDGSHKDGPVHYSDVRCNEKRTHGISFYEFSKDLTRRKEEMNALDEMRNETNTKRLKFKERTLQEKNKMKKRIARIKHRKILHGKFEGEVKLQEEEVSEEELEEDDKEEIVEPLMREEQRHYVVREWDKHKAGVPGWKEKIRRERNEEFAPPKFLYDNDSPCNKSMKGDLSPSSDAYCVDSNAALSASSSSPLESGTQSYGEFAPPSFGYDYQSSSSSDIFVNEKIDHPDSECMSEDYIYLKEDISSKKKLVSDAEYAAFNDLYSNDCQTNKSIPLYVSDDCPSTEYAHPFLPGHTTFSNNLPDKYAHLSLPLSSDNSTEKQAHFQQNNKPFVWDLPYFQDRICFAKPYSCTLIKHNAQTSGDDDPDFSDERAHPYADGDCSVTKYPHKNADVDCCVIKFSHPCSDDDVYMDISPSGSNKDICPSGGNTDICPSDGTKDICPSDGTKDICPSDGTKYICPSDGTKDICPSDNTKCNKTISPAGSGKDICSYGSKSWSSLGYNKINSSGKVNFLGVNNKAGCLTKIFPSVLDKNISLYKDASAMDKDTFYKDIGTYSKENDTYSKGKDTLSGCGVSCSASYFFGGNSEMDVPTMTNNLSQKFSVNNSNSTAIKDVPLSQNTGGLSPISFCLSVNDDSLISKFFNSSVSDSLNSFPVVDTGLPSADYWGDLTDSWSPQMEACLSKECAGTSNSEICSSKSDNRTYEKDNYSLFVPCPSQTNTCESTSDACMSTSCEDSDSANQELNEEIEKFLADLNCDPDYICLKRRGLLSHNSPRVQRKQ